MGGKLPGSAGGTLVGLPADLRIAGYRVEERIGAGGMAVVFRAMDERLGRPVALKVLFAELEADQAFRERFIRESRAAAAVDDPHLIPVYEAGEAAGVLFIAMRYVAGGDVRSLVRRDGPLSPARTAAIVSPVASALDAAHAAGLVHRDVKPANMLLDVHQGRPDHVYLADFGISRQTRATGLTGAGQFLGTLDYAAPEQIRGAAVDGRADQYALACTVFELLSGQLPFHREEATAVIWAQTMEPPPLLTSRRSDLPPAVDEVLAKALAKEPEGRYATCREFADALRGALGLAPYDSGVPMILKVVRPWAVPVEEPTTRSPADALGAAATGPAAGPDPSPPATPPAAAREPELRPSPPGPPIRRRRWLLVSLVSLAAVIATAGFAAGTLIATSGTKPTTSLGTPPASALPRELIRASTPSRSRTHASSPSRGPAPQPTPPTGTPAQATPSAASGASSPAATGCNTTNGAPSLSLYPPTVSGMAVTINGVVIAPAGTLLTAIDWNWGDGNTQTGCEYFPETHRYARAGRYDVVVTTTFSDGARSRASETISVP